jgi:hypothetical protein
MSDPAATSAICCRELKESDLLVGFEVLTPVVMKSSVFWNITPCSPLIIDRHFGETHRLHLNGRGKLLYAGALLGIFFDTGDGKYIFLRNIC